MTKGRPAWQQRQAFLCRRSFPGLALIARRSCGHGAVQLPQLLEESRDGLSQRRVPPVLGPSDDPIHQCHSAHGRPQGNLSSSEVGRDGELMQYIGRGCDTRLDHRGEGRREDARRTNTWPGETHDELVGSSGRAGREWACELSEQHRFVNFKLKSRSHRLGGTFKIILLHGHFWLTNSYLSIQKLLKTKTKRPG